MRFVRLAMEHEATLRAFLDDFAQAGEERAPAYFPPWDADHADAVRDLARWGRGEGIHAGWVPCTTGFVEEDGVLLGVFNVRHHLTEALRDEGGHIGYSVRPAARGRGVGHHCIQGGLQVCRELGIDAALLTCDPANIPSWKVIERAGGVLDNESWSDKHQGIVRRYWVPVPE